jgi:hypothetical protein
MLSGGFADVENISLPEISRSADQRKAHASRGRNLLRGGVKKSTASKYMRDKNI